MDESSFVKKIVADPFDDVPRLVFADWLSDQGDARGEFVRAQCLLAEIDDRDPRRLDLEWIERKWLAEFGGSCNASLRESSGVVVGDFHRGMIHKLEIPATLFVQHWRDVVEACPLCDVRFLDIKPVWDRFVACEGLAHVSGIDLRGARLGVKRLGQLLDRNDLSNLQSLRLAGAIGSTKEIRMIARCPNLAALRELVLDDARTDADTLPLLATAPFAFTLERLSLAGCGLADEGLEALSRGDVFPRLHSLDLSRNEDLDTESWERFFGSPRFARLRELRLCDCRLVPAEISFLARLREPMGLRRLDLTGARFSESAAKSLGRSSCLGGLTKLSLSRCGLTDAFLQSILRQAEPHFLRSLCLSMNRLQADAVAELVHWGGAGGLSELDLSSNPLQETGVSILLEAETLGNLNRLDLQETGLRGAGASQLAASTHFPRLTELRLTYQLLDEQGHAFSAAQKTLIERRFGAHVCHFTAAH